MRIGNFDSPLKKDEDMTACCLCGAYIDKPYYINDEPYCYPHYQNELADMTDEEYAEVEKEQITFSRKRVKR